jgi:hypothetical protein|tara:strand:+ start:464 stop:619 length:156 start_codon:yes stop_codon:yes gene_type:complete
MASNVLSRNPLDFCPLAKHSARKAIEAQESIRINSERSEWLYAGAILERRR